jgi:hypothetical protein
MSGIAGRRAAGAGDGKRDSSDMKRDSSRMNRSSSHMKRDDCLNRDDCLKRRGGGKRQAPGKRRIAHLYRQRFADHREIIRGAWAQSEKCRLFPANTS